jgi:asparagine synthase (glutamine-hydrolysing)
MKLKDREGKNILKKVLYRHVPKKLFNRAKQGFTIPLGEWLKDPLKDWAYDLIDPKKIKDGGFFNSESVLSLWNEHIQGKGNWSHQLWNILMFQMWNEKNK